MESIDLPMNATPTIACLILRFILAVPSITLAETLANDSLEQSIVGVEVEPIQVPGLIGLKQNPLLRIRIETNGSRSPISVTSIKTSIQGNVTDDDIGPVRIYTSVDSPRLESFSSPYADPQTGVGPHSFNGKHSLQHGVNHLWLSCALKQGANIDRVIQAVCHRVSFSDGSIHQPTASDVVQRLGVAIRQSQQGGVHTSRIPGLATTNAGTLIGVYDLRYRSSRDLPADIDVGMSRSTDGGRTWEESRVIMDMGNDKQWEYDGIGDPAILVDRNTGTIWVAATWSHGNRSWTGSGPGLTPEETGQTILIRSDDDGISWSKPINITLQAKQTQWCFLLAGPGNGITMQDGTLVFAAQYQDPESNQRLPHSTILFSPDHGENWQIGTGAFDDTTEAQVVEINPGVLMLNCRYNRTHFRVVMTTSDMGQTWQEHETSQRVLIEPESCMASLIKAHDWLLFSNPDSTVSRKRITIKGSPDQGQSWPAANRLLLDEGVGAGYSCMTMIDDQTIGILYESSRAQIAFQRIPLRQIIKRQP